MSLKNLSDDMLYLIAVKLPKTKLGEMSTMCPRLWNLLSCPRLWKDTRITYPRDTALAFEELFTGPCSIEEINLGKCSVYPPRGRCVDEMTTSVEKLNLSDINADTRTIIAILTKYKMKWLLLSDVNITRSMANEISKMVFLESLSIRNRAQFDRVGFTKILNNCTALKLLDFCGQDLTDSTLDWLCVNMPASLRILLLNLRQRTLKNKHLQRLLKKCPDLTELGIPMYLLGSKVLPKFRHIRTLYVSGWNTRFFSGTLRYLPKISSLRHVHLLLHPCDASRNDAHLEDLQELMNPLGIRVETTKTIMPMPYGR